MASLRQKLILYQSSSPSISLVLHQTGVLHAISIASSYEIKEQKEQFAPRKRLSQALLMQPKTVTENGRLLRLLWSTPFVCIK